jgi:hypothetical protein
MGSQMSRLGKPNLDGRDEKRRRSQKWKRRPRWMIKALKRLPPFPKMETAAPLLVRAAVHEKHPDGSRVSPDIFVP